MTSWRARTLDDGKLLGETLLVVAVTWLLLGWTFGRTFAQADATITWIPYLREQLAGGAAWTDHLYRFGVLGGSAMHDAGGTLPLVQICAAIGIGPTWTANLITLFEQVTIGFFGLQIALGLLGAWGAPPPTRSQRVAIIWATAFAPYLAWRFAYGHDNLVLGLLPFVVATGLVARARSETPSPLALVFGAWAVWNGLAAVGAQLVVYGIVFGAPLLVCLALEGSAPRWGRAQAAIALALVAAALLVLPRLSGMVAHVTSDDFPRASGLTYSFGIPSASDWLGSLAWTSAAAPASALPLNEANVPIGPLALLVIAWAPLARKRIPIALGAVALIAILFASAVPLFSLLADLPGISAFRVPSRALLVPLVLLAPVALAAAIARLPRETGPRLDLLALLAGVATLAIGRFLPGGVREVLALVAVLVVIAGPRWPALATGARIPMVLVALAALGVAAFDERFPRDVPNERIEAGPAALHDQVVGAAPELASPLARIAIVDPPRPFEMSTAFAAGLGSLDGAWFPTRRFLTLLSVLSGAPVDSTTGVFALSKSPSFGVLQQLYNIRYRLTASGAEADLAKLPPTRGAAWFATHVASIDVPSDLTDGSIDTAWVLRSDRADPPPGCTGGKVTAVTVDDRGQDASIAIDSPGRCTLIVATNYVHTLRAQIGDGDTELPVFPVDIALVGIEVPAGAATVVLGPVAVVPWWARVGFYLGVAALLAAIAASSCFTRQP